MNTISKVVMRTTEVVRERTEEVTLHHRHAGPDIRFRLVPHGDGGEWVNADSSTEWGRFFPAETIREFGLALVALADSATR